MFFILFSLEVDAGTHLGCSLREVCSISDLVCGVLLDHYLFPFFGIFVVGEFIVGMHVIIVHSCARTMDLDI